MSMSGKKMETAIEKKENKIDGSDTKDRHTCCVCFKPSEILSIGVCDHVVCYECSARLRVLLRQNDCMICRTELSQVIFTTEVKPFIRLTALNRSGLYNTKYRIGFTSLTVQDEFNKLLENPCTICNVPPFPTFVALKDHMRKEHELFYCDICTDNLMIFSFERKCYNRSNLALHRRRGDPDNTSHKGHPRCEFCDRRYLDRDELFRHLRREHYYCHFCDADGYNHYYADYDALRAHFQAKHFLCEDEACVDEKFTSVFRTEIDLRAHTASMHGKSIGKLATKQARTLEVEFTLAPRSRQGDRSNNRNNFLDDDIEFTESTAIVQHPTPRPIDAQNEQEFPSLGGVSSNTFTVRPSVSIRTKSLGPGGLARTKENFPALGGSSSDVSPIHNTNKLGATSSLFKNGNSQKPPGMVIHVSNRPSSTTSAGTKKTEVNPKSTKDFPSLGRKVNLDDDFVPSVSSNQSGISSKHRSIVAQNYESVASTTASSNKITTIPRDVAIATTKSKESVPKLNSADNFPALGNGSANVSSPSWVVIKKKSTESRISKVAPPPLSAKIETKQTVSSNKAVDTKLNGKNNTKKDKLKGKASEKKEVESKVNRKIETKIIEKSDNEDVECGPSQTILNAVSAKHRSLLSGYEPTSMTNSKIQFIKSEVNALTAKSNESVPKLNSTSNFPSLSPNNSKLIEKNNNNLPLNYADIKKGANDEVTAAAEDDIHFPKSVYPLSNGISNIAISGPPPGFSDKSRKKPVQPPPGFNSVTLNSVAKPTNDLTFTSSLGESYSILPTYNYIPLNNSVKRNRNLFAHFQQNEDPDIVEQFKEISRMFLQGSYYALPYYEHCRLALKDKFDVMFPELLVLLPDISKQQELYLVHSQHEVTNMKNKKAKKNQNVSLEVCATCKQVLTSNDLPFHLQSHSIENNFPQLTNQNIATTTARKKN